MIHLNLAYISLFIILRTNTCLPTELYLYRSLLIDLDVLFLILIFILLPIVNLQALIKPPKPDPITPTMRISPPNNAPLFFIYLIPLIPTFIKLLSPYLISPNYSSAFVILHLSMYSSSSHTSSQIGPFLPKVYPSES